VTAMPKPKVARRKENTSIVVNAAAVQISPVLYSRQRTVEKVVRKIRELGNQGASFPETLVPYYPYLPFVQTPSDMMVG
jgi:nitrilase